MATVNAAAALSVSCTPGTVGSDHAGAAGGSPGPATVSGEPPPPIGDDGAGDTSSEAASGDGGNATTTVISGQTGNCVIHLTNIRADLTVICITGDSGAATGTASGGHSGAATIAAAASGPGVGPAGVGWSDDSASSGAGGNAMAVISSGPTGSCIIFLVNVRATISVICITGSSGPASGSAIGGGSGSALIVAATSSTSPRQAGRAPVGLSAGVAPASAAADSGSGGNSLALVSSGATGNCAISITNVWGSISLQCRTGNSGSAQGEAIGGDSGPALVLLNPPSGWGVPTRPSLTSPFVRGPGTLLSAIVPTGPWVPWAVGGGAVVQSSGDVGAVGAGAASPGVVGGIPDAAAAPSGAAADASSRAPEGPGVAVPISLAAGLLLSGGVGVVAVNRRRRRIRRD